MHSLSAYLVLGQIYFALYRWRSLPFGFIGSPKGQIGTPSVPNVYPFSSVDFVPRGLRSMKGFIPFLLHISYTAAASCAESRIKVEIFQLGKNALMQASPCSMAGRSWREARFKMGKTGSPEFASVKRYRL